MRLTGTIPAILSALSSCARSISQQPDDWHDPRTALGADELTSLDLSSNALQSPIPSSLGLLTALRQLRLNDNCLVGDTIPAGVPFARFPMPPAGDCEMGDQCSACKFDACCQLDQHVGQQDDPTCSGTGWNGEPDGAKRRDTPMCRACGFYETGQCKQASACANASWVESRCNASCTDTP